MMELTRREQQVCFLVVRGITTKEIAMSLGISHRTVEDHRGNVILKYGVTNAVQLTRKVYKIEDPVA